MAQVRRRRALRGHGLQPTSLEARTGRGDHRGRDRPSTTACCETPSPTGHAHTTWCVRSSRRWGAGIEEDRPFLRGVFSRDREVRAGAGRRRRRTAGGRGGDRALVSSSRAASSGASSAAYRGRDLAPRSTGLVNGRSLTGLRDAADPCASGWGGGGGVLGEVAVGPASASPLANLAPRRTRRRRSRHRATNQEDHMTRPL